MHDIFGMQMHRTYDGSFLGKETRRTTLGIATVGIALL